MNAHSSCRGWPGVVTSSILVALRPSVAISSSAAAPAGWPRRGLGAVPSISSGGAIPIPIAPRRSRPSPAMLRAVWSSGIGASVKRREDVRLLTGQGRFLDDVNEPEQVYAAFVRSPHAHAKLEALDATRA